MNLLGQITRDFRARATQDPKWSHVPSTEMRSLVSLIAVYLHRGGIDPGQGVGAVKHLWFIMARTDFATLFKQLPEEEQRHYAQAAND